MGRPNSNLDKGGYDDGNVIRQKSFKENEPNVFRIIGDVIPVNQFWYTTMFQDRDSNEVKAQKRLIRLPISVKEYGWAKEPTIIDALKEVDLRIRAKHRKVGQGGTGKQNSVFTPRQLFVYPVLVRADHEPIVRFLEITQQAHKQIVELQEAKDPRNSGYLRHGPIWCGDIEITKKDAGRQSGATFQNIKYVVGTLGDHNFAGKLPLDVMSDDAKLDDLWDNAVNYEIFTEEEKEVVDAFSFEAMQDDYRPMTASEINSQLQERPLALDAVDFNNNPVFPNFEDYIPELKKIEIGYCILNLPADESENSGGQDSNVNGDALDPSKEVDSSEVNKGDNKPPKSKAKKSTAPLPDWLDKSKGK